MGPRIELSPATLPVATGLALLVALLASNVPFLWAVRGAAAAPVSAQRHDRSTSSGAYTTDIPRTSGPHSAAADAIARLVVVKVG